MARGPRKHLKRLNAPKHWMLSKMDGIWVSHIFSSCAKLHFLTRPSHLSRMF